MDAHTDICNPDTPRSMFLALLKVPKVIRCRRNGRSIRSSCLKPRSVYKATNTANTVVSAKQPSLGVRRTLDRLKRTYSRRGYKISPIASKRRKCDVTANSDGIWRTNSAPGVSAANVLSIPPATLFLPVLGDNQQEQQPEATESDCSGNDEVLLDLNNFLPPKQPERVPFSSSWGDLLDCVSPIKPSESSPKSNSLLRGRCVRFPEEVVSSVIEIPSHRDFTPEQRMQVWASSIAIRLNARRNTKEWHYERCNVHNVVEEDGFIQDCRGTLLHPAHWLTSHV